MYICMYVYMCVCVRMFAVKCVLVCMHTCGVKGVCARAKKTTAAIRKLPDEYIQDQAQKVYVGCYVMWATHTQRSARARAQTHTHTHTHTHTRTHARTHTRFLPSWHQTTILTHAKQPQQNPGTTFLSPRSSAARSNRFVP